MSITKKVLWWYSGMMIEADGTNIVYWQLCHIYILWYMRYAKVLQGTLWYMYKNLVLP